MSRPPDSYLPQKHVFQLRLPSFRENRLLERLAARRFRPLDFYGFQQQNKSATAELVLEVCVTVTRSTGLRPGTSFLVLLFFETSLVAVGGGEDLRRYWSDYLKRAHVLVYVVDASDRSRLPLAKAELHRLLRVEPQLPVVVLGNKQVETSQHEQREPPQLKTQPHKNASPIKCESPTLARKAQVITASTQVGGAGFASRQRWRLSPTSALFSASALAGRAAQKKFPAEPARWEQRDGAEKETRRTPLDAKRRS